EMKVIDHGEAFKLQDERFKRVASEVVADVTGTTPDEVTDGGSSDGRFFAEHGTPFMEVGVSGVTSHQADERCRVVHVRQLRDVYAGIARRLVSEN
ncbi:MAG: M20/M25/M40 family metallo-hydrolase, partial [Candidatus Nanohaloarchaea archaeon]|nr:M20/M25/M40 family metallo-hydrolase [Candidatus Nanohaloarchaea archaeon]